MALGAQIETSETGGDNAKIPLLNSDQEHEATKETIGKYSDCVHSLAILYFFLRLIEESTAL